MKIDMKIDIPAGGTIGSAIDYVINQARALGKDRVSFIFNGLELFVHADSRLEDIVSIYYLKHIVRYLENGYKDY